MCVPSLGHIQLVATPWAVPGSSVPGILQARTLEWVAISFLGDLPDLGVEPASLAWQADSLPLVPSGKH